MDRTERIMHMEQIMEEIEEAVSQLKSALENYENVQSELKELVSYYESAEWRNDFEEDEKGHLPADLKRGVLSEDGVYDLLEHNCRLINRMQNIVERN